MKIFTVKSSFIILIIGLIVFSSCKKDNDEDAPFQIIVTGVMNSSDDIVYVDAVSFAQVDGFEFQERSLAKSSYMNHGFKLELPENPSSEFMLTIAEDLFEKESSFQFSDIQTQGFILEAINAFDLNNEEIGIFYPMYDIETDNDYFFYTYFWMYVDRDLSIKGEDNKVKYNTRNTVNFNLDLKKGWNNIYYKSREWYDDAENGFVTTVFMTNNKPAEANIQWYYIDYNISRASKVNTRSTALDSNLSPYNLAVTFNKKLLKACGNKNFLSPLSHH